jgi:hypothetical protein
MKTSKQKALAQYNALIKEWQLLVKEKGIDLSDPETNALHIRLQNAKKNAQ